VGADDIEFFYSGIILTFKDEVLMYMAQNASIVIFRLFTVATCASQAAYLTYIL
jgi:hypothetical protein